MSLSVCPIDIFDNSNTYDQTKTSLLGKITTKTLSGRSVIGAPIVKYRNTALESEALLPSEIHMTENNRVFITSIEASGLMTIALYDLDVTDGSIDYVGKLVVQIPEPPTTTYVTRGFRVLDNGVSGWKIFYLVTASVPAHAGLYMVNDIALTDFTFVPVTIPTATLPGQKAVYKLENLPTPNITNGAGIFLDITNTKIYVHRGVSATHSFLCFDYDGVITTVGALGVTTDLFDHETGNLPVLSGTLLLTNSVEYTVPASGANSGEPCVIFHTTTFMYRGRIADLVAAAVLWPTLEFVNNNGSINSFVAQTTLRATYSESLQRAILLLSSSAAPATVMIKEFQNDSHELITTVLSADNNESITKEMYKFKTPIAPIGFDSRQGYAAILSASTGTRGIYIANFDADDTYDLTNLISPVIDVTNQQIFRFTAGFVRPDLASPIKVYYRTSGFNIATGGWIAVGDDLDMGGIVSLTGQIQIKVNFKVLNNDTTNGIQLYSCALIVRSLDAISDKWEYSHTRSSSGIPSIVAFRLKQAYQTAVPNLFFRARDLSDNIYVSSTTTLDPSLFEYSTDGGLNWLSLGTVPNVVGTMLRYSFAVPPGIDIRPSLRED